MKAWLVALMIVALCAIASGQERFTLGLGFDYETAELSAMYWPDPNGGMGLVGLTDSFVPEETDDNMAVGVEVQFSLKQLADTIWNTIIPGNWNLGDTQTEPFGKLALLWETDSEHDMIFVAAGGVKFLPKESVHPVIWTEYVRPEGSASIESDLKVLFGAEIEFK